MTSYQAAVRLGRYELIGHLATGGMAEIHLARLAGEAGFAKIVVIKRLLPELVASRQFVAMFLDEARLVARLDHPNICEVHELGRDGAEYFIAMPYLDGIPTTQLIARPRDPDRLAQLRVAAGVIAQACAGLHHAHELSEDGVPLGIVHRDVSPSNLFVTAAGAVKVLDFGVAKVRGATETEVGTIKGKTQYMAPEQVLGEALDRRCDIFALGIVLYELATHQRLFKRSSDYLTARAILEEPIPRADAADPAIPTALADVIAKALARAPADRYADAAAMGRAIAAAIPLATTAELAAAVHSGEELSEMRTRQQRVLGQATPATRATVADPAPASAAQPRAHRRRVTAWIVPALAAGVAIIAIAVANRGDREDGAIAAGSAARTGSGSGVAVGEAVPEVADAEPAPDGDAGAPTALAAAPPRPASHALRPAAAPGFFSIDSKPYATIFIDGHALGVTPIVHRGLATGHHRLRAVLEDGRTRELGLDVPSGRAAPPIVLAW